MEFKQLNLMSLAVAFLLILGIHCNAKQDGKSETGSGMKSDAERIKPEDIYLKLFHQKRKAHKDAVKTIVDMESDYVKQQKIVELMLDKFFKVLTDVHQKLIGTGYAPGDPFPEEEQTRDYLSMVLENTAFLGDILLRVPDKVHEILKKKKEMRSVFDWGIGFSKETGLMRGNDEKLINLMEQELGLVDKDPNYINPYKLDSQKDMFEKEVESIEEKRRKLKEEKKRIRKEKKKKGPRISSPMHGEL